MNKQLAAAERAMKQQFDADLYELSGTLRLMDAAVKIAGLYLLLMLLPAFAGLAKAWFVLDGDPLAYMNQIKYGAGFGFLVLGLLSLAGAWGKAHLKKYELRGRSALNDMVIALSRMEREADEPG